MNVLQQLGQYPNYELPTQKHQRPNCSNNPQHDAISKTFSTRLPDLPDGDVGANEEQGDDHAAFPQPVEMKVTLFERREEIGKEDGQHKKQNKPGELNGMLAVAFV